MTRIHLLKKIKSFLDENQIEIFRVKEIRNEFIAFSKFEFERALKELVDLEYSKIERGKYCRNTFKNEYVIGNFLTDDAVISYWSALNVHGLTEQFPNKIFIQTTRKKENKAVFGVQYHFVKVREKKLFGIEKHGVGSNQFRITDIEKTFLDCFDQIKYSGGFMELIRAFKRTKLDNEKLIEYSNALNNNAVTKRIGYLAELFKKKELSKFIKYAKKSISKGYDLFDNFGYDEGKYLLEWHLKLNLEENDLIEIANSIY